MKLSRVAAYRVALSFWLSSLQYFIVQLAVASSFRPAYSWAHNTISDLGNTACGPYGSGFVCSPHHQLMNFSFILVGFTMLSGALLYDRAIRYEPLERVGFYCLAIAGLGTIGVGVFPENTIGQLHEISAALPFLIGNIGLVLIGISLRASRVFRIFTTGLGAIALLALAAFVSQRYGVLGKGGVERIAAYPQTIWLIIYGVHTLRRRRRGELALA